MLHDLLHGMSHFARFFTRSCRFLASRVRVGGEARIDGHDLVDRVAKLTGDPLEGPPRLPRSHRHRVPRLAQRVADETCLRGRLRVEPVASCTG